MNKILLHSYWFIIITLFSWHGPINAQIGQLEWQFDTHSSIWGNVKVSDDVAYIANDNGHIIALDLKTRIEKWRFVTKGKVRSHAAFYQNLVFFSSDDGNLYALNKTSGKQVWQQDLGDANYKRVLPANHAPWVFDYNKSSPVVEDELVYVGSATGRLFAFQAKDGQEVWRFSAGDAIRSTPTIQQDTLYFAAKDGATYALNRLNGQLRWQHQSQAAIISDPLVIKNKVIIGSRDTNIYALDAHSGDEIWRYTFPDQSWVESSAMASVDGEHFFIGSSDSQKLHKFNVADGKLVWHYSTNGWSWGAPFVHQDSVYVGSMSTDEYWKIPYRAFHAVDALSGSLQWQYQPTRGQSFVSGGVHGQPAIYGHSLLVPDLDGSLKSFTLH